VRATTVSDPVAAVDMDGVLADFVTGSFRLHGRSVNMKDVRWGFMEKMGFSGIDDPKFWAPMGREFWAGLTPTEEGDELLKGIEAIFGAHNVCLLSSPVDTDGCRDGKIDWVRKHLPQYEKRTFLGSAKHLFAAPSKVLVDDYDGNLDKWRLYGGNAVQVPRPWNSGHERTDQIGRFHVREVLAELRSLHARLTRGDV
jgi:hypothetical protein